MPRTIFKNIVIKHFDKVTALAFCKYMPIRFFEILFIKQGSGTLIINGHRVRYADHQIFILIPNDKYNLEIDTPTTITAIKFLNSFFKNSLEDENYVERKDWFKEIEIILHGANRASHIQLQSKTEEDSIESLFNILCNEYNDGHLKSEVVLKSMLYAILHIITRNINFISSKVLDSKIQDIINYIHYYIHDTKKLTKKELANQFHISENYIGQYFRSKMNVGLKKYILNYKIKLAETRLKHTNLTITEIARELGFTDSSHLDKTFFSYKGVTAGNYKLNLKNVE